MKKSVLILIFLFSLKFIFGQENKNYYGIDMSGNLFMSYEKTDAPDQEYIKNSNVMIGLSPFYGYLSNNFLYGCGLDFTSYFKGLTHQATEPTVIRSTGIQFYPFIRYYFESGMFGHIQINVGKEYDKLELPYSSFYPGVAKIDFTIFGASAGLGYSIKAGNHFLIEPQVRLYFAGDENNSKVIGFQFYFGIVYKN